MKKGIVLLLLITSEIFVSQSNLLAQEQTCLLLEGSYGTVWGRFNGEDFLAGNGVVFLLPKFNYGYGFGISIGRNSTEGYYGFKYGLLKYDATYNGKSLGKANHSIFGIEGKLFFPRSRKDSIWNKKPVVQFFVSSAMEVAFIRVKDGFCDSEFTTLGDARFDLITLPIGVGISLNPIEKLSINFGAGYRLSFSMDVKQSGLDKDQYTIKHFIGAGGPFCDVGLCINF
jgi:hypothetical protein